MPAGGFKGGFKGGFAAVVAVLAPMWGATAAHYAHAAQDAPAALPLDLGGPFALTDHNGRAVSDRDFRGAHMLVFFGYANCPATCPIGLRHMTEALDLLGEKGGAVVPLLITVDPERDSVETLGPAVARIDPRLVGLTGTAEQLSAARRAYKVGAKATGRDLTGGALFEHGTFIYLMGPDGEFLTLFAPVMPPEAMAAVIGRYLP